MGRLRFVDARALLVFEVAVFYRLYRYESEALRRLLRKITRRIHLEQLKQHKGFCAILWVLLVGRSAFRNLLSMYFKNLYILFRALLKAHTAHNVILSNSQF